MDYQDTMDLFRRSEPDNDKINKNPVFWIEEIRLLKSLSPEPEEQIREPITFQKGLNIIWAPAPPMNERKEVNFAGHAAGKTTLCRLLRFLIGESNIAAPGVKEAIEDNFYNGWIVGKVNVGSQTWIVARALHHSTRPRSRCLKSDSLDDILVNTEEFLPYEDFQKALYLAVIKPLPVKLFGDGDTSIDLKHVLQWFTRDQDCHLTKLQEFRHTESQSGSPKLTSEASFFLQRVVLNLADTELQEAITECEKLEKKEAKLPSEKEYYLKREKELNQLFEGVKIRKPASPFLTKNLIEPAKQQAEELESKATKNVTDAITLAKKSLQEQRKKLAPLQQKLGTIIANITSATKAQTEAQNTLDSLNGKKSDLAVEKKAAQEKPPSNFCRVPREVAEAEGCKAFCEWDVLSINEEEAEKVILSGKQAQEKFLTQCKNNLENLQTAKIETETKIGRIDTDIEDIESKQEELETKEKTLRAPFASLEVKINELEKVIEKLADLASTEKTLKSDVEKAKVLQETLQKRHLKTENEFIDEYAWTVAKIFGGAETVTKCKFTREKITTKTKYHNKDLTSAAVTALQVLCFDIAAMSFSCRGRGYHPRFLLHDSPREADMGEAPYGRIFDLISEQAEWNPNFQHIITTTTEPPKEFQAMPYLRLKLDSKSPSDKLFKQDL